MVDVVTAARVASPQRTELGEGVRWDARRDELLWLDILRGRLFREQVGGDGALQRVRDYTLDQPLAAVAPVEGADGWVAALGRGVAYLDLDGAVSWIATDLAPEGGRGNDAAVDPWGRLWVGVLGPGAAAGQGALWRIGTDGRATRMRDGMTIPNGAGWSPDTTVLYLVDSGDACIHAIRFDGATGELGRTDTFASWDDGAKPDGLTVAADGSVWVALYGGARVERLDPEGTRTHEFRIGAEQSTCCALVPDGGGTRLYVTSATEHWTDAQRAAAPEAGAIWTVDPDRLPPGDLALPARAYRPDPGVLPSA